MQELLTQSPLPMHILPTAQRAHMVGPPQSTSVSPPFRTMSVQVGVWQRDMEQTLLRQSDPARQLKPLAQRGHAVAPPQSVSVSPPFWVMSVQLGAGSQTPPVQLPLWQSDPRAQNWWMPQRGHAFVPPQSVSVSPSLRTPSVQLGA